MFCDLWVRLCSFSLGWEFVGDLVKEGLSLGRFTGLVWKGLLRNREAKLRVFVT